MGKLKYAKQEGFTVVELMVVLAILIIVLSLGYMFLDFGIRSFNLGEKRSIAQPAIRKTADFISSEIRFASHVTINPEVISGSDDYYYIYMDGNSLYFQDSDKSLPRKILLDDGTDHMVYKVSFYEESYEAGIDWANLVVGISLEAENVYSFDTSVYILNLSDDDHYTDSSAEPNHTPGIKYKKPY